MVNDPPGFYAFVTVDHSTLYHNHLDQAVADFSIS